METYSFGQWLRARRDRFRLTRKEVADMAACSVAMLRKIEDDERRPSEQLARLLAEALRIPAGQLEVFVEVARGDRPLDALAALEEGDGFLSAGLSEPIPRHNLPAQRMPFIGREMELSVLNDFMTRREEPLLTIVGPGGMGKTRLMLQAAREMVKSYEHGVWLAELAPLGDPNLIPERVAAVLGAQEQPDRQMRETLVTYLRPKTLLLLLDNVEHLVQAAAELVDFLIERCPKLQVVATGREPLRIRGETTLQLAPLAMPLAGQPSEMIAVADGVKLFLGRANTIRPDFALTDNNAAVIGEIVRRLDGIPLALELAAARLRMMTVEQINGRLDDRFRLLTGGSRTALPRQQTLRALIDWSWNLLEEKEQLLLQRLAVFAGGWQMETAEVVVGFDPLAPADVFELLEQLINKSLVTVQYGAEDARYYFLETIHQYALDKLTIAGEDKELRERHTAYFIALADKYANNKEPQQYPALSERLRLNGDNLRQVWRSIQAERPGLALRFSGTLFRFESNWISPREAISWLEGAITRARNLLATDSAEIEMVDFTRAIFALAWVRVTNGQLAAGLPLLDESVQLARQHDDVSTLAFALGARLQALAANVTPDRIQEAEAVLPLYRQPEYEMERVMLLLALGTAHFHLNQMEAAKTAVSEMGRLIESFAIEPFTPWIYLAQARQAHFEGDAAAAERYLLLALEIQEKLKNNRMAATIRSRLAHTYREAGRLGAAEAQYRRTILSWQEQGHQTAVANQVECLAYIAAKRGDEAYAARLLGATQAARQRMNEPITYPNEVAEYRAVLTELGKALGQAERDRLMDEGGRLSLDEAVLAALDPARL